VNSNTNNNKNIALNFMKAGTPKQVLWVLQVIAGVCLPEDKKVEAQQIIASLNETGGLSCFVEKAEKIPALNELAKNIADACLPSDQYQWLFNMHCAQWTRENV
jgi:hypothetical protein